MEACDSLMAQSTIYSPAGRRPRERAAIRARREKVPGREALRPPLPKRFYKVVLNRAERQLPDPADGRAVRTPKKPLLRAHPALADAIAVEWAEQSERIDPASMPLTRIANTAIDAVADHGGGRSRHRSFRRQRSSLLSGRRARCARRASTERCLGSRARLGEDGAGLIWWRALCR